MAPSTRVDIDEPCTHVTPELLRSVQRPAVGCEECLQLGMRWVHLRQCLVCGHIGCCDSSQGKHANAHFQATQHAIMASAQPGETWAWCFIDNRLL